MYMVLGLFLSHFLEGSHLELVFCGNLYGKSQIYRCPRFFSLFPKQCICLLLNISTWISFNFSMSKIEIFLSNLLLTLLFTTSVNDTLHPSRSYLNQKTWELSWTPFSSLIFKYSPSLVDPTSYVSVINILLYPHQAISISHKIGLVI